MDVYHVLNRGVEKRDIVKNDDDRMRFVQSLYIFNDKNNAPNSVSQSKRRSGSHDRKCLVHIHAWCLMNNHYHLLLSPVNDDVKNISSFMKKLNMGYAKFFNEKYNRSGYLWQGKYKKIEITSNSQFLYIPYYVHLNPLDYTNPNWRAGSVNDLESAFTQLKNYRWSSYSDYAGNNNFASIIDTKLFSKIFTSSQSQKNEIISIISGNNKEHLQQSTILEG